MQIHWKRKKVIRYINDSLEIFSDDFDKENTDKENSKKDNFNNFVFLREQSIYDYF